MFYYTDLSTFSSVTYFFYCLIIRDLWLYHPPPNCCPIFGVLYSSLVVHPVPYATLWKTPIHPLVPTRLPHGVVLLASSSRLKRFLVRLHDDCPRPLLPSAVTPKTSRVPFSIFHDRPNDRRKSTEPPTTSLLKTAPYTPLVVDSQPRRLTACINSSI